MFNYNEVNFDELRKLTTNQLEIIEAINNCKTRSQKIYNALTQKFKFSICEEQLFACCITLENSQKDVYILHEGGFLITSNSSSELLINVKSADIIQDYLISTYLIQNFENLPEESIEKHKKFSEKCDILKKILTELKINYF